MSAARTSGLWLACLTALGVCACAGPANAPAPALAPTTAPAPQAVQTSQGLPQAPQSIADVYRLGQRARGQNIQLQAQFHGWAACPSSTQSTRSDWAIKQGEACIYVSGGLPQGIAPPPSTASNGMPVFIQAQVVWDAASGKPHLKLSR